MTIALAIAGGLVLLVLLVLAVPVRFDVRVDTATGTRTALASWAFGLVRVDLLEDEEAPEPEGKKAKKKGRFDGWRVVRAEGLGRAVATLVRRVLTATHPRLDLEVRVGLDDPAETGMLYAFAAPVAVFFDDVRIRPDFVEPGVAVRGQGRFTIVPLEIAWIALRFAGSKPGREIVRAAMRS